MPRPKRTKVAPSAPASRVAKLVPARKTVDDPIEDDDNHGRGVITNAKRVRRSDVQKPTASATKQGRMSSTNDPREKSLEAMRKRRDEALERLDAENENSIVAESIEQINSDDELSSSPAMEVGRREVAPVAENSLLRTGNVKRRARQPSILGRGRESRASSIDSDLAEGTGLTHGPRMGDSALRPGARRRARQPSILGRANSRVRSSSLGLEVDVGTPANGGSAFKTGTFRRRARQPSILGTAQKTRQTERGYEMEDEEDFDPEDESTPLNLSKTRSAGEGSSQVASSAVNPRKRKISPVEVTRESSPLEIEEDVQESHSRSSSPAASSPILSPVQRLQTPDLLSETMAPPQSSSPVRASPTPPRPTRRPNTAQPREPSTRKQPSRKASQPEPDSLPSSPPSLTHSPNGPTHVKMAPKVRTRQVPDPVSFSTAQLQALLPRRRQRTRHDANDPFAIDSSGDEVDVAGLGSDDDELSHLTVGTRTRRRTPALPSTRRVTKIKPSKKAGDKSKGKAAAASATSKRTYGASNSRRGEDSDKENEENSMSEAEEDREHDPDDSLGPMADDVDENGENPENSQELEARVGKELKVAKRKFEVVDQWELEFEEVTASSSSPWDAR